MKRNSFFTRYNLLWILLAGYLFPLVGSLAYIKWGDALSSDWDGFSIGLLLTSIGTLILYGLMVRWESVWQAEIDSKPDSQETIEENPLDEVSNSQSKVTLQEIQHENALLKFDNEKLNEQIQLQSETIKLESQKCEQAIIESEEIRLSCSQQLEKQQSHIRELQDVIAEQKANIEKRQQQIGMLETKVGDLTYEIKTLLKLAESHSSSLYSENQNDNIQSVSAPAQREEALSFPSEKQICTQEEASIQLKRCLDIAQKITGSYRFNSHLNGFLDATADAFTLDLRRLCDSLRSENSSAIVLYSPKENKVLFVNNQIKSLTGWSPEKFVQSFTDILHDHNAWKQGISSLTMRSETPLQLLLKTKNGTDLPIQAHLGMIPTGIFRQHAIAILYEG